MRSAEAIGSGITTADNHDSFIFCRNSFSGRMIPGIQFILLNQILHGKVDALEVPTRHRQIARLFSPQGEADGIEPLGQGLARDIHPHVDVGFKLHALRRHLIQPPINHPLLHFEIRNAVAKQPTDPIRLFKHGNVVADSG